LDAFPEGLLRLTLAHFYHVYADGAWEAPVTEHLHALTVSGLLDALDHVFVGVVGAPKNRALVCEAFPAVVVAEADEGWEQVTLQKLHHYAHNHDAKVFYAHTKGAYQVDDYRMLWRVAMTYDTVTRWRECVDALDFVGVAGPYWLDSAMPEHSDHKHFFGGNFWWARTNYLRALPPVEVEHRWQAEGWIGLADPSVKIMREGFPSWGNFEVPDVVV
jgi:hypothetical protein